MENVPENTPALAVDAEAGDESLSPMEDALLDALSETSKEHEERLAQLEHSLRQLLDTERRGSESAENALEALERRQIELDTKMTALMQQLLGLTQLLAHSNASWTEGRAEYAKAVEAFGEMQKAYLALAEQLADGGS